MDYYNEIEKILKSKKIRDEKRIKEIEEDTLNTYYEIGKLLDKALKKEKIRNKGGKRKYEKKNSISCNSISFNFTI